MYQLQAFCIVRIPSSDGLRGQKSAFLTRVVVKTFLPDPMLRQLDQGCLNESRSE